MAVKSSFKNMTLCLMVICLVCSALLAGVNVLTKDAIAKAAEAKKTEALSAVAPEFNIVSQMQTVSLAGNTYNYYALRLDDSLVGYAIESTTSGFGGSLKLMVGFNTDGVITGTCALECNETPGLGAKCQDEAFFGQFKDFNPTVKALKVNKDGGDVDAITASTITSRAYTLAVKNAYDVYLSISGDQLCEEGAPATETEEVIGGTDNE